MIRAAVFDGPGKPFRVEAVARPVLAAGEALVRVTLCTVCGSDLHTVAGKRSEAVPAVLGHEAVGVVEELAGEVRDVRGESVRVGDRVVWSVAASCGGCFFCERGLPQKCEGLRKYGHARVEAGRGPAGGLATHVHLWPGTGIVKVPPGLPDEVAAPAACAAGTVACAFPLPPLRGERGSAVLVLGAGMLGLTACAMASAAGASTILACDRDATRLALARRFGATDTVALPQSSVALGRGADVALEFTGDPDVTRLGLDALRTGGTLVLVGAVFPTPPLAVSPEQLVRRCLTVRGVHNYAPPDLAAAVAFLAAHHDRIPFAELVGRTFPLDEVNDAMRYALAGRPFRVGVRPGG